MNRRTVYARLNAVASSEKIRRMESLITNASLLDLAESLVHINFPEAEPWTDFFGNMLNKEEAFLISDATNLPYHLVLFCVRERRCGEGYLL